uniref:EF-hand domain-containing protein n=1 Tax=Graphocephala atropunctata TaxID=36148 RepID=A0A1B6K8I3_9HEMI
MSLVRPRPRLRLRPSCPSAGTATRPVSAVTSLPWQPDHTLTRRAAHFAREVYSVWCARVGSVSRHLPADQIQSLLNEMQLYPTQAQVCEMLQCAQDCTDRSSPAHLTFGEFCLFATELKRCYHRGVPKSSHLARKLERDGKEKKKRSRKMSKSVLAKHEVFLGGSCNPTTWRHDVAIPLFTGLGITYYNPQVEDWSVELVEQEHEAKQTATVLFYVIDSQTRNVVGMIEAAAFAGARRRLVLVIKPYKPSQTIGGEQISHLEYDELSGSLLVLKSLVERQGIPVFNNIPVAVKCTAKILRDNINMQDLVSADLKQPVNNGHMQVAEKLFKLREAFNNRDTTGSGRISLADVCMAYRLMTNRKLSVSELKGLVSSTSDCKQQPVQVNFEEFCAIIAELKSGDAHNNNNNNGSSEKWALCSRPPRSLSVDNSSLRDVFLAGDFTDLAIPSLKRHGLSYHRLEEVSDGQPDLAAIDNSFVLLFIITGQSRSLSVMTMAGHYIGLGCNVILCIQHIEEDLVLNGEKMSKQAVSDYNRGRIYLKDLAHRDNIPVYHTVDEAVTCAIEKCQSR